MQTILLNPACLLALWLKLGALFRASPERRIIYGCPHWNWLLLFRPSVAVSFVWVGHFGTNPQRSDNVSQPLNSEKGGVNCDCEYAHTENEPTEKYIS